MSDKLRMALVQSVDYDHWPIGGTLTYVKNIIPTIAENFITDIWGVILKNEENFDINIEGKEYQIKRYATVKLKKIIPNFFRTFFGMLRNASKFKDYDIIFIHSGLELIALKLVLRKKLPFTAYVQHGLSYRTTSNKYVKYYFTITGNLAYRIADLVFFVSDLDTYNDFVKTKSDLMRRKFNVIGSPIDFEIINKNYALEKKLQNPVKFLYTGRLSMEKQIDKTLNCFSMFYNQYKINSTLTLIGDGPLKEKLQQKVRVEGMTDKVIFLGNMEHELLVKCICDYDIFLMSSMGEGMSLSTLEAMSGGLPVICYNVAGMRNLITADNGFCVENNDENAFVKAMYACKENYKLLSKGAIETASQYDKKAVSYTFISIILDNYYDK